MAMSGPRGGHGRRRAPMAEINVTPMVDVMLVLLIIFMVTAPLLVTGVPVNLPETRANALEQPEKPVQIAIDEQGQIFLDDQPVAMDALPGRLEAIASVAAGAGGAGADKGPQIYLRADRTLQFDRVMKVMGELNRAGLNRVALVSTEQAEAR